MEHYGPLVNDIKTNFSSRDSLGIESVFTSITADLCPIINTVTPRAFYWPFLCWIYYDFFKNSGIKDYTLSTFDKGFLKRQDYYFVLANLLTKNPDQYNLVGKQKTTQDIEDNRTGIFPFNENYFMTTYGGMQYYNAGCFTMKFITDHDEEKDVVFKDLPRLTQYGVKMALAFERVICNTRYYKEYRLTDAPVPRDVLEEYGSVINLGMKGFDECKALLRYHLFDRNIKLTKCATYARYIYNLTGTYNIGQTNLRHYLYDYFSPAGERNTYPEELQQPVKDWEIAVGRQYFTIGIEMIWSAMLHYLREPYTIEEWFEKILNECKFSISLDSTVSSILPICNFTFSERKQMIDSGRRKNMSLYTVENGLKLALSVYNRFSDRSDLGDSATLLDYGRGRVSGRGSFSLNEWADLIRQYKDRSIRELLFYLVRDCIVGQHMRTCFDKLTRSSNNVYGFYFELVDNRFIKNEHEFQVEFQDNRFGQLMQVMQDLDMFEGAVD